MIPGRLTIPPTIAALGVALVATVSAQELQLTRSVESGVESVIAHERAWDRDCRPRRAAVTITREPAHGTVSVVEGASVIPEATPRSGSAGRCAGKPMTGNQLVYRSHPGFRGTDTVSYQVVYGEGRAGLTTITITVR